MQKSGLLSRVKNSIVPGGKKVRKIRGGILKGIYIPIDLRNDLQVYIGIWERETHDWIRDFTNDINTFIDIGASTGPLTLFALCKTEADSVLAVEPQTDLHDELRRSLRLNGLRDTDRLQVYSFPVGSGDSAGIKPLDAFAAETEFPCFIKCDVDGPEAEVLKSGRKILENGDVRLLVETHSREAERKCVSLLKKNGYSTRIVGNAWWRSIIPEQRPIDHNQWLAAWNE